MAETQTQNARFQPSEAVGIRMAVIEYRYTNGHEWFVWTTYDNAREIPDGFLRGRCEKLANRSPRCEYRYRHGTLVLDPPDKCETFRSE